MPVAKQAAEKGGTATISFPRGLKPTRLLVFYGVSKATPFQSCSTAIGEQL
jgi:hypothetical protein